MACVLSIAISTSASVLACGPHQRWMSGRASHLRMSGQSARVAGLSRTRVELAAPLIASVPEVADAREHHGEPALVSRFDHLLIANRASGLDHSCGSRFRRGDEAVGKWEE